MMAWLDYAWYHERGVCWATDTVGLHAAAAIIAPVDACLAAFRHAHGIGLEWYSSGYWWLFWRWQVCRQHIRRAVWIAVLYLVSALAHIWHDPATTPLHAYKAARSCSRAIYSVFVHITLVVAFTAWRITLPFTLRAAVMTPSAVTAVLAFAHSTPAVLRHAACTAAYSFGCIAGLATHVIARTTSRTGVVNAHLGRTLAARALTGKRRRPKSACTGSAMWKSFAGACLIMAVVDSGCTWHSHPEIRDLIKVRPCTDKISCAGGVVHHASHIGDLPVVCHNQTGKERVVLVRDATYGVYPRSQTRSFLCDSCGKPLRSTRSSAMWMR